MIAEESLNIMHRRFSVRSRTGLAGLLGLGSLIVSVNLAAAGMPAAADLKLINVIDVDTSKGELHAREDPQSNTLVLLYVEADQEPRTFVGSDNLFFEQLRILSGINSPDIDVVLAAPRTASRDHSP